MPNNLVGEQHFCSVFQKIPGSEKDLEKKGEYQKFSWKVFCLRVPNNLVGEQLSVLCFREFLSAKNF